MNAMKIDKDYAGKNAKFKKKVTKGDKIYALFVFCFFFLALIVMPFVDNF